MSIFSAAISLFFILNSLGAIPIVVSILGNFPLKKQRRIILRELLIALFILILFTFFGDEILKTIGISHGVIGIAGGTLLFLISLSMIFPKDHGPHLPKKEPFIFPLAVPLIAGPGSITTVIIYAQQISNPYLMLVALILAWIPTAIILMASSNIKIFLGHKGLLACEKLGGMLICLIAVQMLVTGIIKIVEEIIKAHS